MKVYWIQGTEGPRDLEAQAIEAMNPETWGPVH